MKKPKASRGKALKPEAARESRWVPGLWGGAPGCGAPVDLQMKLFFFYDQNFLPLRDQMVASMEQCGALEGLQLQEDLRLRRKLRWAEHWLNMGGPGQNNNKVTQLTTHSDAAETETHKMPTNKPPIHKNIHNELS